MKGLLSILTHGYIKSHLMKLIAGRKLDKPRSKAEINNNSIVSALVYAFLLFVIPVPAIGMGRYIPITSYDDFQVDVNGLKYKVLKAGTPIEKQMKEENTFYVIRYFFDLKGKRISIPAGCVLKFEGGALSNGTLVGQNTAIEAGLTKVFDNSITIEGDWSIKEAYPEWFCAVGDGVKDDTQALQKALSSFRTVKLSQNYLCSDNLFITDDFSEVNGNGTILFTKSLRLRANNCDHIVFRDFTVRSLSGYSGVGVACGSDKTYTIISPNNKVHYSDILIDHITVDNYSSGYKTLEYGEHSIFVKGGIGASIENITISNCNVRGSGVSPNAVNDMNGCDNIYLASYKGQAAPMRFIKILNNICEYAGRQNLSLASSCEENIIEVLIDGNTFKNSTMAGVDFEHASKATVSNNVFVSSGKYTGYYNPDENPKYRGDYALRSAIAGAPEDVIIQNNTFIDCRNAIGGNSYHVAVGCKFINSPLLKSSAASYNLSCTDCTMDFRELEGYGLYTYANNTFTEQKFANCVFLLGRSTIKILSSGTNITVFDKCSFISNTNDYLFDCASERISFNECSISVPGGMVLSSTSQKPVLRFEKCTIVCDVLMEFQRFSELLIKNCDITANLFALSYNSPNMAKFEMLNNTAVFRASLVVPFALENRIDNNSISFDRMDNDRLKGIPGYKSTYLFFTNEQFDGSSIFFSENIITGIPEEITHIYKGRSVKTSKSVNTVSANRNTIRRYNGLPYNNSPVKVKRASVK